MLQMFGIQASDIMSNRFLYPLEEVASKFIHIFLFVSCPFLMHLLHVPGLLFRDKECYFDLLQNCTRTSLTYALVLWRIHTVPIA